MLNLKICIIGDELTGKSSICDRYVYDIFNSKYEETVGINYKNRIIEQKDNLININCWDISGNDNYIEIRNEFYKDCHAILVVFDLTARRSFDNIKKWIQESIENGAKDETIFLIGNKADDKINRNVKETDIKIFAKNYKYFEVSAKDSTNVQLVFDEIIKSIDT